MPAPSTHSGSRDDAFRDQMQKLLESSIPESLQERIIKQAQNAAQEYMDGVEYWVKDELADILSGYVADMADRAVTAMLEGNEAMFRRYLKCEQHSYAYTGRDKEHPVIHGKLFEYDGIKLRRMLCDEHADMLKTERLLDLEDQVRSLVETVNKKEAEIERLRDMYR